MTTDALHRTQADDPATGAASLPAGLERALTEVARSILRLEVPQGILREGESVDKAAYWLLVRMSEHGPLRLSDLADSVALDLSTVSRQVRSMVESGFITKEPDPQDGRAFQLALSERGVAVLEAVSDARQQALARAVADWTDDERTTLAAGLFRLAAGLHSTQKGAP